METMIDRVANALKDAPFDYEDSAEVMYQRMAQAALASLTYEDLVKLLADRNVAAFDAEIPQK